MKSTPKLFLIFAMLLFVRCQNNYDDIYNENEVLTNDNYLSKKNNESEVNILTYNIHSYLITKKDEALRLKKITQYLKENNTNYDVILFTEIWRDDKKEELIDSLRQIYPYSIHSNNVSSNIGDGLLVLSKIPIGNTHFFKYKNSEGFDWFAKKGFWKLELLLNQSSFYVFLTHAQADEDKVATRTKQLQQIKHEIDKVKKYPTIIAGDINIIGNSKEYRDMFTIFSDFKDSYSIINPDKDGYTYDNTTNELAKHFDGGGTIYQQRLDYILYSKGLTPITSKVITDCKYTNPNEQIWDCSDHYGLATKFIVSENNTDNSLPPFIFNTKKEAETKLNSLKNLYGTGLTAKIIIANKTDKSLTFFNKSTWYTSTFYSVPPNEIPPGKYAVTLASHDTSEATGVYNQLTYTYNNNPNKKFSFGTYVPWSWVYTNNVLTDFNSINYTNLSKYSSKNYIKKNDSFTVSGSINKGDSPFVYFEVK
ncbi:endonuclease/exonuclease/phosphatase family protein [uncultured Tenacibaculum sp.]|uniref:endonuclease/exonuclease/phosphatase family protein n=1 Tax=uncultured Tenacibaculum sp. TaxID=174713 RepID=UPI00260ACB41|nr:endonuclease/exonuclease/phosphatase family protein [uncultured Tenacibaculum sp.]